jgi:hypothetical protein
MITSRGHSGRKRVPASVTAGYLIDDHAGVVLICSRYDDAHPTLSEPRRPPEVLLVAEDLVSLGTYRPHR